MGDGDASATKVEALLDPRNIVIVGASDRPGNWSMSIWNNLQRYGFRGPVYPVNPGRETVWGVPCYADLDALPELPDQLLVLIPAGHVVDLLEHAARLGARSATVYSSGFEETGSAEGIRLGRALRETIARTGLAVSGPNCLGNLAAKTRLVTMTDRRPHEMVAGPVAILGQSGGVLTAIKRALNDRGIDVGYLVTSGNEAGLAAADYIRFFADQPEVRVVVCYVEALRKPADFLTACRAARAAGKPVVVVKVGGSEAGRAAALAHTGALAGEVAAFDAVAGAAGAVRVRNLDDLVETVELFLHARRPAGPGVGAITFSGGLRALLLDGAAASGVTFPALAPETRERLATILGVGTIVGNPLDAGFTALSSQQSYLAAIRAMLDDPGIDLLLLQEEIPRNEGIAKEDNLRKVDAMVASGETKPIAFVGMVSYHFADYSRALRRTLPHVAFLQEVDKTLRAVVSVTDYAERARRGDAVARPRSAPPDIAPVRALRAASAGDGPQSLDEASSKALLRAYGLQVPDETIVRSPDDAVAAARSIGFPVVLKIVSAAITHKSEVGGVRLDLRSDDDVRRAYGEIAASVAAAMPAVATDAMLVAPHVSGGLELVLGIQNDPDMGCVVLFGSGGVWLELFQDVAIGPAGLDRDAAEALVARTRAATLLAGYRGARPRDRQAVVEALAALGRLADELGDLIESVDVNPFVALEEGGVVLDALVVARRRG